MEITLSEPTVNSLIFKINITGNPLLPQEYTHKEETYQKT